MTFRERFERATDGQTPYPYQVRLATESWPDVLSVPTGLGKTAAVGLAWIHRRLEADPDTPRRLVYVLPMRVLAEQTVQNVRTWLDRLGVLGNPGDGGGRISVSLLMGGSDDVRHAEWPSHPDSDAILIGTQDMLLSRALLRGYGMSRYQWPVHFGLLHADALWVFDEVQLMGPALATSAQLEAFRRAFPLPAPSRSLWLSATLRPEWLGTVDFREHLDSISTVELDEEDRSRAHHLLRAPKSLERAAFRLTKETQSNEGHGAASIAQLARDVHRPGTQTLVIVNRVDRAQEIYRQLAAHADAGPELLLLHARFRPGERREIEERLRLESGPDGRIVVATQAVEAGVDISSTTLISELAPWASMVQRFGRNNRYGKVEGGGRVVWVDSDFEGDPRSMAPPYDPGDLQAARSILEGLAGAGIDNLPEFRGEMARGPVLRRKDFLQLFDTDPDLSGYDVDIAPYIRDRGTPQVQVFWRSIDNAPGSDEPTPARAELCPVSLTQLKEYAKKTVRKTARMVWEWDPIMESWQKRDEKRAPFRPGGVYLLDAQLGGYDPVLGFDPQHTNPVQPLATAADTPPGYGTDAGSIGKPGHPETLASHIRDVTEAARTLAARLELPAREARVLVAAARWHDIGKAHPAFQTAMRDAMADVLPGEFVAKSGGRGGLRYRIEDEAGDAVQRRFFRHELASMLAWLSHNGSHADRDLIAYLIAAHHGKVRMGLRALPREKPAPDGRRHARGVWEGDTLPAVTLPPLGGDVDAKSRVVPETVLSLRIMELGRSPAGPSWAERTQRLLAQLGPFHLAWLESLIRIADWRGSATGELADGAGP